MKDVTVKFHSDESVACCLGYGSLKELRQDYSSIESAVKEIWLDAQYGVPVEGTEKKMYDILQPLIDDYIAEVEHQGEGETHLMDGNTALVQDFLLYYKES